jgi:hypothetical protein
MKLLGGFLIALAIYLIWMVVVEIGVGFMHTNARFAFNWPDFWQVVGYLGFGILMLVLGIVVRRRKPKNWIW